MVGAICLGPSGNMQGSFDFLNLRTGTRIHRRRWTPLPMPQDVIDRVNQLGSGDGMPKLLTFYDRHGNAVETIEEQTTNADSPSESIENGGVQPPNDDDPSHVPDESPADQAEIETGDTPTDEQPTETALDSSDVGDQVDDEECPQDSENENDDEQSIAEAADPVPPPVRRSTRE